MSLHRKNIPINTISAIKNKGTVIFGDVNFYLSSYNLLVSSFSYLQMLSIISMCHKFHFTDNIKIIKFILLCILQIKHCIIEITIFCYFQFSTIYIYYTEGVRRINRVIFVYIALIITLVRFFTLFIHRFQI